MSGSEKSADPLTTRQHRAIAALLTEPTHAQAAAKAKVAEGTLRYHSSATGRILDTLTAKRLSSLLYAFGGTAEDLGNLIVTQS